MYVVTFATSTLLLLSSTTNEPPKKLQPPAYFPTVVGTKWVYDLNDKEESKSITAVERKGNSIYVTVRGINTVGGKTDAKFKIDETGLYQVEGASPLHPPMHLLKLPHKVDQKWDTWMGAWGNGDSTLMAYGPESIEVPAGKFDAIRVETKFPSKVGEDIVAKYWYAPSVGLVKEEYGKSIRKLKSFTLGKE